MRDRGRSSAANGAGDGHPALAVVDVGSNSGRLVVFSVRPGGYLEVIGGGRAALQLAREFDGERLSEVAIERTVRALRDFRAIAERAGASPITAVGTAAVRRAANAAELIERSRVEAGIELTVVSGQDEGRYGFLGTVYGLPVYDGAVLDVGGGSIELSSFTQRTLGAVASLPLGALTVSDRFLTSDPPKAAEITALQESVREQLEAAGVERLGEGRRLLGTGGTVRNLARIDREASHYPISRLHGYVLSRRRLDALVGSLASRRTARRGSITGLNADRADSIVGGAVVTSAVMEYLGATDITVSGQGLREGVAYELLGLEAPSPEVARRASIDSLVARFSTWEPERSARRVMLAERLVAAAEPEAGPNFRDRVVQAAHIVDVGRSIDYYERYRHAADIVIASDLAGFTHRKLALLAAVLRQGDDERLRIALYRPLLDSRDRRQVSRAATLLALADEIEQRVSSEEIDAVTIRAAGRKVVLRAPIMDPWRTQALAGRFRRSFGSRLEFEWQP